MGNLRLFTSNRMEVLAGALAEVLRKPLRSPLDQEIILVQSRGMEHWVSMQMAERHGICANYRFPFPNTFLKEIFRIVIPDLSEDPFFDPKILSWQIMKRLTLLQSNPGFESIKNYLGKEPEGLKIFQLSEKIADLFDQYQLFRPDMIYRWERGEETVWHALLWRELIKGHEEGHRAAKGRIFFERIKDGSRDIEGMPERVSVFGISALPRFHIQVLEGISKFCEVNLFLMNPCKEYWGDILSEGQIRKAINKEDASSEELHLETGNSLLASMGTLGKEFFDLINETSCEEVPVFNEPGGKTLLTSIQSDILNLADLSTRKISPEDLSIQIHSCHSPMREVEVLRDRLLDMFERNPELKPGDILVMTPDIESYTPYIQAVFDVPVDDNLRIPFSIADRSIGHESDVIECLFRILDLHESRFEVSSIFALLDFSLIRRKFGIGEDDVDSIIKWIQDVQIRWGIDAEDRKKIGLPSFPENTWRAGLDRLLLGYAMIGKDENMFEGCLPYDNIEGGETSLLGDFIEFIRRLTDCVASFEGSHPLSKWAEILNLVIENFFMPDEREERGVQSLRQKIKDLADLRTLTGAEFNEEIGIDVIKWHLTQSFRKEGLGVGFLTGGVTFCAMLPMRSIPFKVICLIGLNGNAYPRDLKPLSFDLMAKNPRAGDRSRRNDDRYLFLEALLSARECLYISYPGQSIQDNSNMPPSILVSELMDYIAQNFQMSGKSILDHITRRHRLQPFSPYYFGPDDFLFSYSKENRKAAEALISDRNIKAPFISKGLTRPGDDWTSIDLRDLCAFFAHPTRFILNRRLGLRFEEKGLLSDDREAFDVKGLERYQIEDMLLKWRLAGRDLKDLFPYVKGSGRLPHGSVGECVFHEMREGVENFVDKSTPYIEEDVLDPLEANLDISGCRITGIIENIYPGHLFQYRYAKVKARDRLIIWVYHLALNYLGPDGYPRTSILTGLDPDPKKNRKLTALEFTPLNNGENILSALLDYFRMGLVKPLHFFPESSWVYVDELLNKKRTHDDALRKAKRKWQGSDFIRGECEDDYYQLCFKGQDPFGDEFVSIALGILGPLLEYEKRIKF